MLEAGFQRAPWRLRTDGEQAGSVRWKHVIPYCRAFAGKARRLPVGGREFFSKYMDGSRHDDMLIEKRLPRLFYLHRDLYAIAFQCFPPLHPKKVKKCLLAICQIVYLCAKYFFRYLRSNRHPFPLICSRLAFTACLTRLSSQKNNSTGLSGFVRPAQNSSDKSALS